MHRPYAIAAPSRERGVVMVITLLAILLLVALVLWVLNMGEQVDHRVNAQHAADSAVAAGSGWVARSMNTVAQNNLTISRYITVANVLDGMPLAVEFTTHEQKTLQEALVAQLARGVGSGPTELMEQVQILLEQMNVGLEDEIAQLEPVNALFLDIDVREMTCYNAPGGMGRLWQAMYALDEVSQATMENLPELAQLNAASGGAHNLPNKEKSQALVVPINPYLPYTRGQFDDFRRPVLNGLLPLEIDDTEERRGPFDTVFGWHKRIGHRVGGTWVPGSSSGPGGRGNVPIGGGAGSGTGGSWVGGTYEWTHYTTWGWLSYYISGHDWFDPEHGHSGTITSFVHHHMYYSRLAWWVRMLANIKIDYLWPEGQDTDSDDDDLDDFEDEDELETVIEPLWVIDYNEARSIAAAGEPEIRETAFFVVEIKSKYPKTDPQFMTPGTWAPVTDNGARHQPRVVRRSRWMDPATWGVEKIVSHGWRDEWTYRKYWDSEIDITPISDGEDGYELQTIYRYDHFYFAGVNVGEPLEVRDPNEGLNRNSDAAPAPLNLVHDSVWRDPTSRREFMTFLGIASRDDHPQAWASAFHSGKPHERVVALAQAKVFNSHSWDLWTPMWRAQIEPITRYDLWMNAMENGLGQGTSVSLIDLDEVEDLYEYLDSLEPLAPAMLGH